MTIRPPGRVTRTTSLATSNGLGANIAPKMLTTRSKLSSSSSFRSDASPSWNLQLVRPRLCARALPAATRLLAMSTPRTFAPSLAAGTAVVPSPHPRSRTSSPSVIPSVWTSASPLSRMLAAMRVKSPFSQSALFGFIGWFLSSSRWGCANGCNARDGYCTGAVRCACRPVQAQRRRPGRRRGCGRPYIDGRQAALRLARPSRVPNGPTGAAGRYAAVGGPNQVVSASASPGWVRSPTQATYPSGRISTAVGAVTAPSAGSSHVPTYSASIG